MNSIPSAAILRDWAKRELGKDWKKIDPAEIFGLYYIHSANKPMSFVFGAKAALSGKFKSIEKALTQDEIFDFSKYTLEKCVLGTYAKPHKLCDEDVNNWLDGFRYGVLLKS